MRKNKDYMKLAYKELRKFIEETPKRKKPRLGLATPLVMDSNGVISATYTKEMKFTERKKSMLFKFYPSGRFTLFCDWHAGNKSWESRMYNFTQIVNPTLTPHNRRIKVGYGKQITFQNKKMVPKHYYYYQPNPDNEAIMMWCNYHKMRAFSGYHDTVTERTIIPSKDDFWGIKALPGKNRQLRPVKDWARRKWYKIMSRAGRTGYAHFNWDMPKNGKPGDWHEVNGELEMCGNGIHVCSAKDVGVWWTSTTEVIVEMEVEGPVFYDTTDPHGNKKLVRKARVKRIVGDLTTEEVKNAKSIVGAPKVVEMVINGNKLPTIHKMTFERTILTKYTKTFTGRSAKQCRAGAQHWMTDGGFWHGGNIIRNTLKTVKAPE